MKTPCLPFLAPAIIITYFATGSRLVAPGGAASRPQLTRPVGILASARNRAFPCRCLRAVDAGVPFTVVLIRRTVHPHHGYWHSPLPSGSVASGLRYPLIHLSARHEGRFIQWVIKIKRLTQRLDR